MKYLFTGGGTGGHVYPALAVADELRRRDPEAVFLYVGMRGRIEERIVPARGYALRCVRARPFPRSSSPWALARFGVTLGLGILRAAIILLRFRPHLIFGTGGYVSAPVMFASGLLRKLGLLRTRLFIYEPNAHPGLLNQAVGRLVDRVGVVFEQAGRWFDMKRVAIVGFPVRRELATVGRAEARRQLGIGPERFVVFAFGGSQGSRVINRAVVEALPHLAAYRERLFLLHGTGQTATAEYDAAEESAQGLAALGLGDTSSWYRQQGYFEHIETAYAAADVVVCRGGMSTLTEVGVCGLPAVIVPLSTASEDHQAVNARALERLGAALVLYEGAAWQPQQRDVELCLDGARLAHTLLELVDDAARCRSMGAAARQQPRRDSLVAILVEIEGLLQNRRPAPTTWELPVVDGGPPTDPNRLLRYVRSRLEAVGGVEALCPRELAYLRYQADRHLASRAWYEIPFGRRNVGVKLAGLLGYTERLDLVLALLRDRTSAPLLQRLAGGDYHHPGILRRNVVDFPLAMIGWRAGGPRVRQALLEALRDDPYFEVRVAAATVLGAQAPVGDVEVEEALRSALDDPTLAVVGTALRGLARIGCRPDLLDHLRRFYVHPDWRCRQETVRALDQLLERRVLRASDLIGDLEQILSSSPNFEPVFTLKDSLEALVRRVRDEAARHDAKGHNGDGRAVSQAHPAR